MRARTFEKEYLVHWHWRKTYWGLDLMLDRAAFR